MDQELHMPTVACRNQSLWQIGSRFPTRMPWRVAAIAMVTWLAVAAADATAGMYYLDTFESPPYTVGPLPPSALDGGYYTTATSGIIGINGWQAGGYTSDPTAGPYMPHAYGQNAYVVANPNTSGSPASGVANTSANAVALVGNSSGGAVHPSEVRVQPSGYSPTFPTIGLKFDMLFPSAAVGDSASVAVVGFLGLNWTFGNYGYYPNVGGFPITPSLSFDGSVNGGNFDPFDSKMLVVQAVTPDVWHRIEVTFDTAAKTALYTVDNSVVATYDVSAYLNTNYSQFNVWMDGDTNSQTASILMDNVTIVPEPTQMVLVAGVGAALGVWTLRKGRPGRRHSRAAI